MQTDEPSVLTGRGAGEVLAARPWGLSSEEEHVHSCGGWLRSCSVGSAAGTVVLVWGRMDLRSKTCSGGVVGVTVSSKVRLCLGVAVLLTAGMAGALLLARRPAKQQEVRVETSAADVPLLSASAHLNSTSPEATFIGSDACAECHREQFESYLQTAHSRALSEVDPDAEPPDAEFRHDLSGHSYAVFRRDGQLWHRESLVDAAGEEVVQEEHPLKYLIGSGRHTRSYLVEDDGFLMESPITWYASRQAWEMSPGYDAPVHAGFERATDIGCLFCHVGRAEPIDGSFHRIAIHEQSIGCESCHGPGSLHARERKLGKPLSGDGFDPTIVHPAKLPRGRLESICAQCHLRGDTTVAVRGRSATDFRPGQRLADFRIDYFLKAGDSEMKVVGHVEQMRLSRCYQSSETLTCTTCHDPHSTTAPEASLAIYRQRCVECHSEQGCGEDASVRDVTEPVDNCMQCHMPRGPTDIPHISFTHHRIGVHGAEEAGGTERSRGELVSFDDLSSLPPLDRDRCLGLGYLELSEKQADPAAAGEYRRRGRRLIEQVYAKGLRDPDVLAALASFAWEEGRADALELSRQVLATESAGPRARGNALAILSDVQMRRGEFRRAAAGMKELTNLRRNSEDWLRLGLCRLGTGDRGEALRSLLRAAEISPSRSDIHAQIGAVYWGLGDPAKAAEFQEKALRIDRALEATHNGPEGSLQPSRHEDL